MVEVEEDMILFLNANTNVTNRIVSLMLLSLLLTVTGCGGPQWKDMTTNDAKNSEQKATICARLPLTIEKIDNQVIPGIFRAYWGRFTVTPGRHLIEVRYGGAHMSSPHVPIELEIAPGGRIEFYAERKNKLSSQWRPVSKQEGDACLDAPNNSSK